MLYALENKEFLVKLIASYELKKENTDNILNLLTGVFHGYTTMQLGEAIKNPEKAVLDVMNIMDIVLLGICEKYK